MLRSIFIGTGVIVLIIDQFIFPVSTVTQYSAFFFGVLIVGIPHGAADLLVASQKALSEKKVFSKVNFFSAYLYKLLLFGIILWFLPVIGLILFIVCAAYHFGETDLYEFKTSGLPGKLFVTSYGLTILGVLLFHRFDEVKPILEQFAEKTEYGQSLYWIQKHRYTLLSLCELFFVSSSFLYFLTNDRKKYPSGKFLIQYGLIIFIIYNLPLMVGFTFYFVLWHSVLSLTNILSYLKKNNQYSFSFVYKQITVYSLLAFIGIGILALAGSLILNVQSILLYVFVGLALLTAPHLSIMHEMYNDMRSMAANRNTVNLK